MGLMEMSKYGQSIELRGVRSCSDYGIVRFWNWSTGSGMFKCYSISIRWHKTRLFKIYFKSAL